MRARASRKRKVSKNTDSTNAKASTPEKTARLNNSPLHARRVRVEDLTPGILARPPSQEVMSNTSLSYVLSHPAGSVLPTTVRPSSSSACPLKKGQSSKQ